MSSLVIKPSVNTQIIGSLLVQASQLGFAPKIFISSTIDDLKEYREAVAQALKPSALCLMIQDWPDGHWDVIEVCRKKVDESYGYVGIFAYYYGSIPPGQTASITHLEYQWVQKKWETHPHPPIVIFMPDEKADVHKLLKQKADSLVHAKYDDPKKHTELLEKFRTEVLDWHIVKFFTSASELQVRAVHAFYNWGNLLMNVAQGNATIEDKNSQRVQVENQIGLLARSRQLDALKDIFLMATKPEKVSPAVCMVVHGDEHSGHTEFAKQLSTIDYLRKDKKEIFSGKPPVTSYDAKVLVNWIAENLGILEQPIDTPEDLAMLVWGELQHQQLAIFLDDIGSFVGGIPSFREHVWRPFYDKLSMLSKLKKVKYPLFLILVVHQRLKLEDNGIVYKYLPPDDDDRLTEFDYSKLLELPRLGKITEKHVIDWLETLQLPDRTAEDLRKIASEVLKDENGEEDTRPFFVYKRIRFLAL